MCPCGDRIPPSAQDSPSPALFSPCACRLTLSVSFPQINFAMTDSKVPQPGPARLKRNAGPDEWLEAAKDCKYLSEAHMKQLCEMVKEYMMEGEVDRTRLFGCRLTLLCSRRIEYSTSLYSGHHLR